ncbi:MAG TPA: autotransporter domain-containing protein [Xanthomonadaceae bacterium]|nr:autotransporter domain-containing protein [Xanthomonadaceae bacterium]
MNEVFLARTLLAAALALVLGACGGGGGGGGVRSDPPPSTTPPSPPPTDPPPTDPPPTTTPTPQPSFDAHLRLVNAQQAHDAGHTGAGYRIGVVDTGVNRNHPALQGRVVANYSYVDPRFNNLGIDDVVGHGTTVAQLAAGAAVGAWPGGVAPGAQVVSARIINDESPKDDGSGQGNEVNGALGLQPIHEDLIAAGVRIMNNSWGGLYWDNPAATAAIAAEYRSFVFGNDGLVVFATGNESSPDPTDMAALPSQPGPNGSRPAADLERGWLAVAALDTANPSQLADYSNACGVAMRYCLAAPGTVVFTGHDDTAARTSYYYNSGTSFAAPLVSGAAALVWEAFPYFGNDLVRQTLLGTARDLGAPGVDAVFGYGLLDVGKALRGPGRFDWGDVHVVLPAATSSVWSNDIGGAGGLVVDGAGNRVDGIDDPGLWLAGDNTFTGGLRVGNGATVTLGGAFASDVEVEAGAYLYLSQVQLAGDLANRGVVQINALEQAGSRTVIAGDVVNHGVFFNREFPGTTLAGSFSQGADGEFWTWIGTDPLQVSGRVQLDGRLYLYGVKSGYVARYRTEILLADGGVDGRFAQADYNTDRFLLEATVGYDANSVWLDVDRVDVAAAATRMASSLSAAALAAATRVEGAFQRVDAHAGEPIVTQLPALPAATVQGAAGIQQVADAAGFRATLESLSGELHALATARTFDSIDLNRRTLMAQLDERRPAAGVRAWSRAVGGVAAQGGGDSRYRISGWMLGQDVALGGAGIAGFAFGETRADNRLAGSGDHGHDRQTQAQFYAGCSGAAPYAVAQLGGGRYQRQVDRGLLLGPQRYGVYSRYAGSFLSAALEGGYRLGRGRAGLTPYLGAQHSRVRTPGFSETGGLGFGLRAERGEVARSQLLAGLRGAYAGRRWRMGGYLERQQLIGSRDRGVAATFTGIGAWAPLPASPVAGASTLAGLDATFAASAASELGFGYDSRLGGDGEKAWSLRYRFGF